MRKKVLILGLIVVLLPTLNPVGAKDSMGNGTKSLTKQMELREVATTVANPAKSLAKQMEPKEIAAIVMDPSKSQEKRVRSGFAVEVPVRYRSGGLGTYPTDPGITRINIHSGGQGDSLPSEPSGGTIIRAVRKTTGGK